MYYVYVLKSLKDGQLYKGYTSDITARIKDHNKGKIRSTKSHRPYELVHLEFFQSKTEARKRELFLKSGAGRRILTTILNTNNLESTD